MRQVFLFIIALLLLTTSSFRQPQGPLSKVDRLYYTCKIWGFLKYYHPLIGKGSYNWDDKLLSVLDKTENIGTYSGFSTYMDRWIYAMGAREKCKSCQQVNRNEPVRKNFDLSWTQTKWFSDGLKVALKDIENNRFQGDHHYIGKGNVGQFDPKNEDQDLDFYWEDEHQRLLPLFRFWNYVAYFYPYKYLTDQPWDEVLKEMIPKFLGAKSKLDLHLAMLELVIKVDDGHANFTSILIERMPLFNYLPVRLQLIDNQVIVAEMVDQRKAQLADLQPGDVILRVNDQPVMDLHKANKKYIPGSNEAAKNLNIYYSPFIGIEDHTATITLQRDGSVQTKEVTLYKKITDLSYTKSTTRGKWETLEDSIRLEATRYDSLTNGPISYDSIHPIKLGYVDMGQLLTGEVDLMMGELTATQALIFDIRNQPQGTYRAIARHLNPTKTEFAAISRPDLTYPGKFRWQGTSSCGEENPDHYKGKVILLINEQTQSHAEFTCMCLQTAPSATTIGSRSAGANGNVSMFRMLQRLRASMSGIGVYYPDGRETQRTGILPDVEVKPTLAGIITGQDEVLEKAIAVAKAEITKEETAKLKEAERLREVARLAALARRQQESDSLQMINELQTDSLVIDGGEKNK